MSTIPFDTVANIVAGVLSAGGDALDLNEVVLSQSIFAPQNEILAFANAPDAQAYFGAGSPEAQIAATHFQGPDNKLATPGALYFLGYAENAVPGWLLGISSTPATLAELQALSGTLIINVGGTEFTSSEINFSAVGSFSAAAAAILAAFTDPSFTVVFDPIHQAFLITSTATGAAASITFATGTLASALGLDAASGGTLSQGANAAVPAAQMNSLISMFQNWMTFQTTWLASIAERQAFAAWSASVAPRYLYLPWDTDAADDVANNPDSFGGIITALNSSGTLLTYGTMLHAAFVGSYFASLNFNAENGRRTLCFQSQAGLAAAVDDQTTFDNVTSNGYNVYGSFGSNNPANNQEWMTPGSVAGPFKWADTYGNQVWFNAQLQLGIVTGLRTSGQVPYNANGDVMLAGFVAGAIKQAGNFGVFRTGITLSASQVQQVINLVGSDVSATITAQGYYLFTDAANTDATVREARGSPPAILLYQDGESIQSITMPSIVIQ
jgi:Protein of unknown function (DUF3383)